MAYTSYVTNDYTNWTNSGFTLYWSNSKCKKVSYQDQNISSALISKQFTIPRAANVADITVNLYRHTGDFDNVGYAYSSITLIDADAYPHLLYEAAEDQYWTNALDQYDITLLLSKAGTYTLELYAEVRSSWFYESGYHWDESEVHFYTVLLRADTDATTNITLNTETTTPTDILATYQYSATLIESTTPIETFQISKFSPPAIQSTIICVGTSSDHKICSFRAGSLPGYFETPEIDFTTPGMSKTLDEITFESHAITPHIVSVYVSLDGGTTWIYAGQDSIYSGKRGFVYPWLTAETFVVRFSGTALYLSSYELYAVPGGKRFRQL
jgi:hypothetical protein